MRPGFMKFVMRNRSLQLINATAGKWTLLLEERELSRYFPLDVFVFDTDFIANYEIMQDELADETFAVLDFCVFGDQKEGLFYLMSEKRINPRNTARNFIREMER